MKKLIVFLFLLVVSTANYSQPTTTTTSSLKTYYLQRSKDQKIAGFIFLGGGVGFIIVGRLLSKGELVETTSGGFWGTGGWSYKNYETKTFFTLAGIVSSLISIPIFTSSFRNKRKAIELSFKSETVSQIKKSNFVYKSLPSLTLKISL